MPRKAALFCTLLSAGFIWGQTPQPPPNPAQVDSPDELQKLKNPCGTFTFKGVPGCVEELFTGHPLHIALGSIAPQNGVLALCAIDFAQQAHLFWARSHDH